VLHPENWLTLVWRWRRYSDGGLSAQGSELSAQGTVPIRYALGISAKPQGTVLRAQGTGLRAQFRFATLPGFRRSLRAEGVMERGGDWEIEA
jgi:hypothetical protein